MSQVFLKVLLFSLIPVCTMLAGGAIAVIRKPGKSLRSIILHFAAGVVFSVVAVEILPDVIRNHSPVLATIGFVLGFGAMVGIRKLTEANETAGKHSTENALPWGLLVAIGVDVLIDGLLLGIGFAAGNTEGMLLAFALSVELLSLGMATATELGESFTSRKKIFGLIIVLASVFLISSVLGVTILQSLPHQALQVVLSFGLSALLFLVTEELLTEAHEIEETTWHTAAFFVGFLLFMILGMYA